MSSLFFLLLELLLLPLKLLFIANQLPLRLPVLAHLVVRKAGDSYFVVLGGVDLTKISSWEILAEISLSLVAYLLSLIVVIIPPPMDLQVAFDPQATWNFQQFGKYGLLYCYSKIYRILDFFSQKSLSYLTSSGFRRDSLLNATIEPHHWPHNFAIFSKLLNTATM